MLDAKELMAIRLRVESVEDWKDVSWDRIADFVAQAPADIRALLARVDELSHMCIELNNEITDLEEGAS